MRPLPNIANCLMIMVRIHRSAVKLLLLTSILTVESQHCDQAQSCGMAISAVSPEHGTAMLQTHRLHSPPASAMLDHEGWELDNSTERLSSFNQSGEKTQPAEFLHAIADSAGAAAANTSSDAVLDEAYPESGTIASMNAVAAANATELATNTTLAKTSLIAKVACEGCPSCSDADCPCCKKKQRYRRRRCGCRSGPVKDDGFWEDYAQDDVKDAYKPGESPCSCIDGVVSIEDADNLFHNVEEKSSKDGGSGFHERTHAEESKGEKHTEIEAASRVEYWPSEWLPLMKSGARHHFCSSGIVAFAFWQFQSS